MTTNCVQQLLSKWRDNCGTRNAYESRQSCEYIIVTSCLKDETT